MASTFQHLYCTAGGTGGEGDEEGKGEGEGGGRVGEDELSVQASRHCDGWQWRYLAPSQTASRTDTR